MNQTLIEALDGVLGELAAKGILRVEISYFGNDGEGRIDHMKYVGADMTDENLDRKFEDLLYELLDVQCPRWDNGDGSDGTITVYMPEGYIQIIHTQEYTKRKKNIIDLRVKGYP